MGAADIMAGLPEAVAAGETAGRVTEGRTDGAGNEIARAGPITPVATVAPPGGGDDVVIAPAGPAADGAGG